ncbi:DDE-type integrase/transposase/recombinase [Deinococcus sp.]|uniref:DDE-type integrase/transposase/recombinase n=1 Tax=Deinococcus sp. TaxID=47478 RepID=UPI003C7DE9B4
MWRAVNERGLVLDTLLHSHRDNAAAENFMMRLTTEYHVPDTVFTSMSGRL